MKSKLSKVLLISGLVGVVTVGAAGLISVEGAKSKSNTTIPESVSIEGISVAGMSQDEAKEALAGVVDAAGATVFTLKAGDNTVECSGSDLGITSNESEVITQALNYGTEGNILERYVAQRNLKSGKSKDFELTYSLDKNTVTEYIENATEQLNDEAVDGTLSHENGKFTYVEGQSGYCVKVDDSVETLRKYVNEEWDGKDAEVELDCEVTEPRGSKDALSKIKDELGTYNTSYAGSDWGRKTNIEVGSSKVSGTVLYPGDEMSVADKLGKQDAEHGYAQAASYENGEVVQTYGGGVCQISTTLYNAVIRAELEVTERHPHSMMVGYVSPSEDAAIAEGAKDLKFKNNLDSPVYVEMIADGATLYASIYGQETRPANRTIEFESEVISRTSPQTVYVADPSMPIGTQSRSGSAHTGYKACLWKVVKVDGAEESREKFNSSSYRASNVTIAVGTGSADPEAAAQMGAAVASGDASSIAAAASEWNDAAVAQRAQEAAPEGEEQAPAEGEAPAEAPAETPAEAPAEEVPAE